MKKFAYRQYSIRELYDSYTRNEIIFPSQYNEIPWIKQHKEKLLNMIIHRYPVKGIAIHVDFIMEKNSNIPAIKKNIVYGQQELKTIFEYLKTDFTKLCEDEKRKVMNYTISATVLFDFTDEEINNTIKILR